jgi:hypothetical protein
MHVRYGHKTMLCPSGYLWFQRARNELKLFFSGRAVERTAMVGFREV